MKNSVITMLAALALSLSANAQEVMKVELKNGQVATYNVEDISRFYFEGAKQQEELATDCKISIVDEVVMNSTAALELNYDKGIENVYWGYLPTNSVGQYSDDIIVAAILQGGLTITKDYPYIYVSYPEQGYEYTICYFGVNASGKRGDLYMYHLTSTIKENEPVAEVTGVKVYDDKFEISIAIDKNKVQKYYASAVAGDDIGYWPEALFGIIWKKQSINSGEEQVYTESKSYDFPRANGENRLAVYTWACGYDGRLSGYIDQSSWRVNGDSRIVSPVFRSEMKELNIKAYSEKELMELFDSRQILQVVE